MYEGEPYDVSVMHYFIVMDHEMLVGWRDGSRSTINLKDNPKLIASINHAVQCAMELEENERIRKTIC